MNFNYVKVAKKGNGSHHLTKFKRHLSGKSPKQNSNIYLTAGCSEWVSDASDHNRITLFFTHTPPPKQMENLPFLFHIFTPVFLTCCNGLIGGDAGLRDSVSRDTVWNPSTQRRLAKRSSQYTCRSMLELYVWQTLTPSYSSFLFKVFSREWH